MSRQKRFPDARTYARVYAQRRRERKLAELQRTSTTCPRRAGTGRCGAVLETLIDREGRTRIVCPLCERRKHGICRDCPRPVEGRIGSALRCAACKKRALREQLRMCDLRHKEEYSRNYRAQMRKWKASGDPRYLAKLEYKRAYRKTHRDKVRAQKHRSYERHRETIGAYMVAYRAKHRAHYRDIANKKVRARQALWTPPICQACGGAIAYDWQPRTYVANGIQPTHCDAHCWPYLLRRREKARAALVERARAEMNAGVPSRSRVHRRPPGYHETRAAGDLRRCLTPGCTTVLTGRKKKCERCKEREAAIAAPILAQRRGRGRRTDLQSGGAQLQAS